MTGGYLLYIHCSLTFRTGVPWFKVGLKPHLTSSMYLSTPNPIVGLVIDKLAYRFLFAAQFIGWLYDPLLGGVTFLVCSTLFGMMIPND